MYGRSGLTSRHALKRRIKRISGVEPTKRPRHLCRVQTRLRVLLDLHGATPWRQSLAPLFGERPGHPPNSAGDWSMVIGTVLLLASGLSRPILKVHVVVLRNWPSPGLSCAEERNIHTLLSENNRRTVIHRENGCLRALLAVRSASRVEIGDSADFAVSSSLPVSPVYTSQ
jgi:hypothetical protein